MSDGIRQEIDLRGLTCPEPVIRTKKLFDKAYVVAVEALVDDNVCVNNLQRLARTLKVSCEVEDKNGYFAIKLERGGSKTSTASQSSHTHPLPISVKIGTTPTEVVTVLFITKDYLGEGDPDFSKTLCDLFLQTVFASGHRPRAILLVNSGVRLLAKDSSALKVLNDFRDAGVEVLACGLCVDFYKLKQDIATEQITNMFAICEYLFAADKIIQP